MRRADFSSPRGTRLGVALIVAALHVALVLALVRAFAPQFTAQVARQVFGTLTVTVTSPPPQPPSPPAAKPIPQAAEREGGAAEAGKRSVARPVAAPAARIVLAAQTAPPIAGRGRDDSAGARDAGAGTGAGGQGSGMGSGNSGSGQGGGGASRKLEKIAGDINMARDYPAAGRQQRSGDAVIIALTVGIDGQVQNCRIVRPSKDSQADQITCRLAAQRFRFRPRLDAQGNPVVGEYQWIQRWWDPREKN
ncbi:MAG: TonB family protein [Sphingomonadales bacterium]|nr:TonB family protein [Sphingomonadales bacterium]